jgi:predicted dehydrogenase
MHINSIERDPFMPNTQRINRRELLKSSGAATFATVGAPLFARNLFAGDSPNDKINVASIGVGGRGTGIGLQAAKLGSTLACCDVSYKNAERFQKQVKAAGGGECRMCSDYRELLAKEEDVDAVTIGTPDHWHVKIAIDAMKAGKHVYCEKPLTLTIEEGVLVNEAVKKYGKTFQVGTQQRSEYGNLFLKAVAIARSGRLGDKLSAVSSIGPAASRSPDKDKPFGPFETMAPPSDLDWNMWLGQAPAVDFCPQRIGWNFRWWFEYSGGQVTDWGVHHTDIAFWALSGGDGHAVEAEGKASWMHVEREKNLAFLLGELHPDEMPVGYNVAYEFDVDVKLSTGNVIKVLSGKNELLMSGERGRIRVNRGGLTGKPVEDLAADPKGTAQIEEMMAKIYGGELPSPVLGHMTNFFESIKRGRQPVANVADHVRAVNATHLANIALLTGKKVVFDPVKNRCVGDDQANGLTKRKRRGEFDIVV